MATKAWERRDDESAKAFEAFEIYRRMPAEKRTLAAVGSALGKSATLMERWSSVHEWAARCRSWDDDCRRRLMAEEQAAELKRLRAWRKRNREAGAKAISLAVERMNAKGFTVEGAVDVYRMIKAGLALEQAGYATELTGKVATSGDADAAGVVEQAAPSAPRKLEIEVIGAGGQVVPASELTAERIASFFDKPNGRNDGQ